MFQRAAHGRAKRHLAALLSFVTLAATALVLAPAPVVSAGPRLALSESTAAVGDEVTAKGRGFARRVKGTLSADGVILAKFRTNRRGRISVPFSVQAQLAPETEIVAKAAGMRSSARLKIKPNATTSPSPTPTPTPTATPIASATPTPTPTPTPSPTASTSDAYVNRVRSELKVFTDWLGANGVQGYMGEIGWPNNQPADQDRFNALADTYLKDMQAAGLKGAAWATGEWWGTSYGLSTYIRASGTASINTARPQATVTERYPNQVGVHVNGGEFGAVYGTQSTSSFSNVNRGTYNTNWHYDNQGSFNYLASRGIKEVVIPFRWERIQPTLGGALDAAELTRLKDAIGRAGAAGMKAVPMVANYAAYWLHDPATNKGVRRAIGSSQVPVSHFSDLWTRLSAAFKGNSNISSYGLMREPAGMAGATTRDAAKVWENASQAAVNAIRANGDAAHLLVSGYQFSNTHTWPKQHPAKWITDSANNHSYEAHHYWASTYDASYKTYDEEVAFSKSKGY